MLTTSTVSTDARFNLAVGDARLIMVYIFSKLLKFTGGKTDSVCPSPVEKIKFFN